MDALDVGFILDGSETLGKDGFKEIKKYVAKIMDSYEISEEGTHIGVVEFSENARVVIPFDMTFDTAEIKRVLNETEPSNKKVRNADVAFELAKKKLFSASGGSRPGVPRVVIFVTSGKSTGRTPMKHVVEPFKNNGIRVYVVAVGNQTDPKEDDDTASDEDGVIPTDEPKDLPDMASKIVDKIGSDIRKSKNYTIQHKTTVVKCYLPNFFSFLLGRERKAKIDMIIAFGSQGINALSLMEKEKSIAIDKIESDKDSSDIRYGLINYADIAGIYSKLGEFSTKDEVADAIGKISWAGEGTGLHDAISEAAKEFKMNGRPDAYKIFLVFVTGPAAASLEKLNTSAQKLFDINVRVIPVLLGENSDEDHMKNIVLSPKDVVKPDDGDEPSDVAKDIDDTIKRGELYYLIKNYEHDN